MLRAYRSGLLKPQYEHPVTSRIRENWLLSDIAAEQEADMALRYMQLQLAFAPMFENPTEERKTILAKALQLIAYGYGDPTAMSAKASREVQEENLRLIYKAMLDSGQLNAP